MVRANTDILNPRISLSLPSYTPSQNSGPPSMVCYSLRFIVNHVQLTPPSLSRSPDHTTTYRTAHTDFGVGGISPPHTLCSNMTLHLIGVFVIV